MTLPVADMAQLMLGGTPTETVRLYRLPGEACGCTVEAGVQGLRVASLSDGTSPAAVAGLQEGDIISSAVVTGGDDTPAELRGAAHLSKPALPAHALLPTQ